MTARIARPAIWGLAVLAAAVAMAGILLAMGRVPICECGSVKLWHGAVNSAENSQHIADWYAPSHVVHGLLFYGLFRALAPRAPLGARMLMAALLEAAWEIVENTPMVINRYREATMALGYTGDSVVNSVSDLGFMLIGFAFAARVPVWVSVASGLALELLAMAVIRDNLTLNVLMLLWPVAAIRDWQAGLGG
ncbi:DUF2585 domain-containing protein [Roseomonas xinghualingensis]|uniref:DUF2585 domain-containing protein n=1 Tax=Roseomonas xinghualingensis TaxID=2986475 RepID=UPI0021F0C7D0|nr:DUF2585 domain-containing protein [Roseomonas sp. SXEYE001]MCV4206994.1 DUF2585 domain-containing protein [Roseomonas sp. SXEYE001]